VVVFTGAGISTESGIPDYRSQGGIWDKFTPVYFDEFMASEPARIRYWEQRMDMEKGLKHARPNTGHLGIARLHDMGRLKAVITQNIDGLHQASGIPADKIIELHGNTRRVRCMSCRTPHLLGCGGTDDPGRKQCPAMWLRRVSQAGHHLLRPGHAPAGNPAGRKAGRPV
jgi:NAD-dependent SIR2 family protein deacetylase